jgi:hypothetical protein
MEGWRMQALLPVEYLARHGETEYAADIWHAKPCPLE